MNRQSRVASPTLASTVVAALTLGGAGEHRCLGFELALPDVGTNVSYDFSPETPVFVIADGAPTQKVLQSRLTFADEKHLRIVGEADRHSIYIDLTLRAPGIAGLFEPIFYSFDETLSLLGKDGARLTTTENTSISYYDRVSGDEYGYGWGFHFPSDISFYGLEWAITPSLEQGAQLPDSLTLETYMYATGAIRVVPEPTCAALATAVLITFATIARPRRPLFS